MSEPPELDLETGHLLAGHDLAGKETRLADLDSAVDGVAERDPQTANALAPDLFGVVDALDAQAALRRALTDPGSPPQMRRGLAQKLLGGQISEPAVEIVGDGAALRWSSPRGLGSALERQGVRAELIAAQGVGKLDNVEDELFRFERLVAGDRELRQAIADRSVPVRRRADLVSTLLDGKAEAATVMLARRAVGAREGTFARTIEHYLVLAAELRQRSVATVRVARPLDSDQYDRLQAALTKQAGRPIAMHVIVDPEVVGGVRVEVGDQIIDGTTSARIEQARRTIR